MMKITMTIMVLCGVLLLPWSGEAAENGRSARERELAQFIKAYLAKVQPLLKESNLAYWQASITGRDADYERMKTLDLELRRIYGNRAEFEQLKTLKASGEIREPLLARQLELLYNSYLPNQVDPDLTKRIVELSAGIQQRFHTYRGTMAGTTVTLNEINTILTDETDSRRRELAWRASKQVGGVIAEDLRQLARLRNEGARKLGFANFHAMTLETGEQSVADLDRIFAQLDELTRAPYAREKAELDRALAARYGIEPGALMPWHYHDAFFQRAPQVLGTSLDEDYKTCDVRQVAERFYGGIGLPITDILERSDLYERPGKDQHAFSTDIDREGDVRILANLKNNEEWMTTALHELGHAVYSKNHDRQLPYLLRDAAHPFCTEAVAMFFGRLSRNPGWMQAMLGLGDARRAEIQEVSARSLRLQQLIFARWAMVMYHFEKALYANPDQDLNTLWWDLVEKYQMLRRPAGPADAGWASKLHFTVAPCYYHNYMLGELLASQWHHYIIHNVMGLESDAGVSWAGDRRVGVYFREKVFAPGTMRPWSRMIEQATGEPLTPKYFVEQFVK